jgi:anti-sigma factor RsiW
VTQADRGVEPALSLAGQDLARGAVGVAELTHDIVRSQLSDFLDGSLDPSEHRRVAVHLGKCRGCSAYLATLRQTVDLLGQLPPRPAPRSVKDAILQQADAIAAEMDAQEGRNGSGSSA